MQLFIAACIHPSLLFRAFSSVAASAFGVVYLSMIISVVTNLLAFSPDEQALVGESPALHPAARRTV
jgi:hypothetical protein